MPSSKFNSYLAVFAYAFCTLLSMPLCRAQLASPEAAEAWKAPHFSVDPKAMWQAASAVTAPEGANETILVDDDRYTFDDAGRITHVGHVVYKILTQKGAEGWTA